MTERNHTKGPWATLAVPGFTLVVASAEPQVDGRAFGIAVIPHHEGADTIPWDVKEANMSLIGAAPELIAMADAFSDLDGHGPNCEVCCNGGYCARRSALYERVHELHEIAIAKAAPTEDTTP